MGVKRYAGEKYLFEVVSKSFPDGILFTITAIDRASGKCSQINNLNAILSEFIEDADDPRIEDEDWVLTLEELESFEQIADELFQSKDSLAYLQFKLDEDRWEGEWANVRQEWNSENWIRLCMGA